MCFCLINCYKSFAIEDGSLVLVCFFFLAFTCSSHCVTLFLVLCDSFYSCLLDSRMCTAEPVGSNYLRENGFFSGFFFFNWKPWRYIPFLQPVLCSELFPCVWELNWELSLHSCVSTQDQRNKFAICYRSFIHGAMWNIKQISFVFS